MNRLDMVHTGMRAELPASITTLGVSDQSKRARLVAPLTSFYLAIVAFMGCGAAVIVTVSAIALRIQ